MILNPGCHPPDASHGSARRIDAFPAALRLPFVGLLISLGSAGCGPSTGLGASDDPFDRLPYSPELQALVESALDRQTEPLLDALGSGKEEERAVAAYLLASVQDPVAGPGLVHLLKDSSTQVRREAAFALGQLGSREHALAILDAIRAEDDPQSRRLLLEALGKGGDQEGISAMMATVEPAEPGLARALFHFGRRRITDPYAGQVLLQKVQGEDLLEAEIAAKALAIVRRPSEWGLTTSDIRGVLKSSSPGRVAVADLLGLLAAEGEPADLELLTSFLERGTHWQIRHAAALALGAHSATGESPSSHGALWDALEDPSPHVATTAASALVALSLARRGDGPMGSDSSLHPAALAGWVRSHLERPSVGAVLLPALIDTQEEPLVVAWARGEIEGVSSYLAFPALALSRGSEADKILLAGIEGDRRGAYVAAAALADRLDRSPDGIPLFDQAATAVAYQAGLWGPLAPASDVRGLERLLEVLLVRGRRTPLVEHLKQAILSHPHPSVQALVGRFANSLEEGEGAAPAPRRAVDWELLRHTGRWSSLEFVTAAGSFVVVLDGARAPLSVSALVGWANQGRLDGLTFHRVEADFILQSGDFSNPLGYGGPDVGLRSEFTPHHFSPGVIGMASSGKDTEGSQYFITHDHAPSLDGRYAAIGQIISGLEVAHSVALGDSVRYVRVLRR